MAAADIVGWYDFEWSGGKFDVCFRPAGHFFAPKFQALSRWKFDAETGVVNIDWGKYGKYIMKWDSPTQTMDGMLDAECVDFAKDWRKAKFRESLSTTEKLLLGAGAGSEWELVWKGGSFPIQFKADGYNNFRCVQFPAHCSHWSLDGDRVSISWAEYGNYELIVDPDTKTMSGACVGAADPPADHEWRMAKYVCDNCELTTTNRKPQRNNLRDICDATTVKSLDGATKRKTKGNYCGMRDEEELLLKVFQWHASDKGQFVWVRRDNLMKFIANHAF